MESLLMIQITRNLARQLRSVLRRALNLTSHGLQPAVVFESGPDGLRIRCHSDQAAVEYYQPGKLAPERIVAPIDLLADCEGRKEEPLTLDVEGTSVLASWRDGSIPQIARYETPRGKQGPFPELPGNLTANEPRLRPALQDAASTTNPEYWRYALGCLQLRPTGQIVATDGRQVLVQNGFAFPWQDDLLVPANKVFGCRELPQDEPLLVGGGPHRVTLQTGPWIIHLSVLKEGRFPQVDELLRRLGAAVHRAIERHFRALMLGCDAPSLDQLMEAYEEVWHEHADQEALTFASRIPTNVACRSM
jgi:hypothetical protein